MSAKSLSPRIPAVQLCHVRLAVSQPQAAAAFVTDIVGLQRVANELEPFLFRSDQRYHTLCLTTGTSKSSIGIEITSGPELDQVAEALAGGGFSAREATAEECAQRFVRRALIVQDATGNEIDLVLRPAQSGRESMQVQNAMTAENPQLSKGRILTLPCSQWSMAK